MKTDAATDRNSLSQPLTRPMRFTFFSQPVAVAVGHSVFGKEGDGFVPVMLATALVAAAVLLAFD
jgi:hypothetical protein